jgi:ADP-ribose pyrophosphatase
MNKRPLPKHPILIPEHAECVFRGKLFDVYQWEQEMFDGSFETFEMLRRPDTIAVVAIDDRGEIIACSEEQPGGVVRRDHIPAGRIDASDASPLEAAKREVEEKVGYRFKNWKLFDIYQPNSKMEWFIYTFVAWGEDGKVPVQHDAGEKITEGRADFETVRDNNTQWTKRLGDFSSTEELLTHVKEHDEY